MVDGQLLQYIVAQEHAGYTEEQIRAALLGNGYAQRDVDAAFRQLTPARRDDTVHEYAQQYFRQGISAEQAFAQLTGQGYSAGKVRTSIKEVYGTSGQGGGSGTLKTAAFVVLALLIGAASMYLLLGRADSGLSPADAGPVQGTQSLSPSEIIAQVLETTRAQGQDAGVQDCHERLVGEHRERCLAVVATAAGDRGICTQIVDAAIHDSCLMNFLNQDFDAVCASVRLAQSQQTCASIAALQQPGA